MAVYSIIILCVVIYVLHSWLKGKYNYWEAKGVKGPTPVLVVGNFGKILTSKESLGVLMQRVYKAFPKEKLIGIYQGMRPTLLIKDPELVKQVLIKDFNVFQDRGVGSTVDEFDHNLFRVEGEKWRILRQKQSPLFSSGKLKNMMPLVENCAEAFIKYVDDLVQHNGVQECRELAAKYTLAVICSCAFGVDVDCFNDKPNAFRNIGDETFAPTLAVRMTRLINSMVPGFQDFLYKWNIIDVNAKLRTFFLSLIKEIIQDREGKPKTRHDFMDLMIELKEQGIQNGQERFELSAELVAAQAVVFHAAGFETSSATMSFLIHELAINPDIQDSVYDEICEIVAKHNGKVTYDSLSEMSYLEMCFDETSRKYPIVHNLNRSSGSDYEFPGLKLKIKKDTPILIPSAALHHDPQYYPNPEVFDPERFTPENKAARPPCTFLPFGEGPRHCIGLRFAKMQSMMGLVAILRKFKMERCEKTEDKVKFDHMGLTLTPLNGIWIKFTNRC